MGSENIRLLVAQILIRWCSRSSSADFTVEGKTHPLHYYNPSDKTCNCLTIDSLPVDVGDYMLQFNRQYCTSRTLLGFDWVIEK